MSSHPPAEQLAALVRGELDEAGDALVRAHLASCPQCAAAYAGLAEEDEALARQLRGAAADPVMAMDAQLRSGVLQAAGLPPDAFPGYELIEEIHRGGQGVVYKAVQRSTKRHVAIKVMKDGPFASRRDQARFEREVEVLAQLNHPGIVAIHDSGRSRGHFYFVMDYVPGVPLDVWGGRAERSVEETLRLFALICEAVNAAHLRGVMHRDLKPGNILIDDQDRPHVLDFGLAKRTEGHAGSLATMTGQFMGSLPWASPEQAEGVPGGIDVRTDVYSLGVILYRLLTGQFPYEVVGSMREVLDRIVQTESARPSTIRQEINDEVDTIVLTCLAKEPERRYQSAGEIARDIGHYLAGEPIEAKRDSALYVLRKRLHRHRISAIVTTAFLLLVTAAAVALLVVWRQAVRERDRAVAAEERAVREKAKADDESYVGLISLAEKRVQDGQWALAQEALVACPPWRRRWEWGHLALRAFQNGADGFIRFRFADEARSLAFSPDGERLVVVGFSGLAAILEIRTGQRLFDLSGHQGLVEAVAWSGDGRHIATGGEEGIVRLWNPRAGAQPRVLGEPAGAVGDVAFSPDSRELAVGAADGVVRVYDVTTGRLLRALDAGRRIVNVRYDHRGTRLAAGLAAQSPAGGQVRVWNMGDGQWNDLETGSDATTALTFSPDETLLATANADGTRTIFNLANLGVVSRVPVNGQLHMLDFSPDGQRLILVINAMVHLYDVATWREIFAFEVTTGCFARFSPKGDTVATCGGNRSALVWLGYAWAEADYPAAPSWAERIAAYGRGFLSQYPTAAHKRISSGADLDDPVSRIRLLPGGALNGRPVGPTDDSIHVAPGERIAGTIRVKVWTRCGFGSVAPVAATVTWGEPSEQAWEVKESLWPGTSRDLPVCVDKIAPLEAGTYYIVIACGTEMTYQQVMSATNWTYDQKYHHVEWTDDNNVGFNWSQEQYWEARTYGCTSASILSKDGPDKLSPAVIGATWVRVIVTPSAVATRPAAS